VPKPKAGYWKEPACWQLLPRTRRFAVATTRGNTASGLIRPGQWESILRLSTTPQRGVTYGGDERSKGASYGLPKSNRPRFWTMAEPSGYIGGLVYGHWQRSVRDTNHWSSPVTLIITWQVKRFPPRRSGTERCRMALTGDDDETTPTRSNGSKRP